MGDPQQNEIIDLHGTIEALEAENARLREEALMQFNSLAHFCDMVNAGEYQGGGREYARRIHFAFENILGHFPERTVPTQTAESPMDEVSSEREENARLREALVKAKTCIFNAAGRHVSPAAMYARCDLIDTALQRSTGEEKTDG